MLETRLISRIQHLNARGLSAEALREGSAFQKILSRSIFGTRPCRSVETVMEDRNCNRVTITLQSCFWTIRVFPQTLLSEKQTLRVSTLARLQ
jgi:hypothetical protein